MKTRKPQNVPRVLQRKTVAAPAMAGKPRTPVSAPPVYRPQAKPRCLQLKKIGGAQPARSVGPCASSRRGMVVQRMEVTKGPPSDEVKSDITLQRNGPLDALPPDAMMKILSHLDVRSASRLAQSQKSMHNLRSVNSQPPLSGAPSG